MLFAAAPDLSSVVPAYKCGTAAAPTICYGTDSKTDALFRSVQVRANYFAPLVGFSPLYVDGKLGPATVSALQKIAQRLLADPMTAGIGVGLTPVVVAKETVAKAATQINHALFEGIERLRLTPVSSPVTPSPSTPSLPTTSLPLPPVPRTSKTWLWVTGIGLATVAGVWWLLREPA